MAENQFENLRDIVPWRAIVKPYQCFEVIVNGNYCTCIAVLDRTGVIIDESTAERVLVPMDKIWARPGDVEPLIERYSIKSLARRNHSKALSKAPRNKAS